MVEIVGSNRGEVEVMQGCESCREYGSLMSVQGCLDLILVCEIGRPLEAFPASGHWLRENRCMSLQQARV